MTTVGGIQVSEQATVLREKSCDLFVDRESHTLSVVSNKFMQHARAKETLVLDGVQKLILFHKLRHQCSLLCGAVVLRRKELHVPSMMRAIL